MKFAGVGVGRLSERSRAELLRRAREATPTYDHLGSTLDPARWAEPAVHTHLLDVGRGEEAFRAARAALQTWVAQRGIGAEVIPANAAVAVDETVVLVVRRGPFFMVAPTRVVKVVDGPRRFAYAYGTLPGHPESGEESFDVEQLPDDTIRVVIRVRAVPASLAARAAGPIALRLQAAALRGYLDAIAGHVTATVATRRAETDS